ncbi:MAG: hypothetical protein COW12_00150 [Candidatus Omnitrophica bacterium CG12_big_fil_rev_8_21_14_0_65_45_16]|nr:MAG: hypothetical protein COW12_00150 [Candidatus Omnitrophica bacterium CG12_big_fil_rev_8_21_14_0_65_45_16]
MNLMNEVMRQPAGVVLFIFWVVFIQTLSVMFARSHREARWILAVWIGSCLALGWAYQTWGPEPGLGLIPLVLWLPLLILLWLARRSVNTMFAYGKWYWLVMITLGVFLALDGIYLIEEIILRLRG